MRKTMCTGLAVLAVLFAAGQVAADSHEAETAAAESVAWDQARATELAQKLEAEVEGLARTARVEQLEMQNTKSSEAFLIVEDLRSLTRHSRRLARHLGEGATRDETAPLFRRMMITVRGLRTLRPTAPLLSNSVAEIDKARAVLIELAAFYGETVQPPVAAPPVRQ